MLLKTASSLFLSISVTLGCAQQAVEGEKDYEPEKGNHRITLALGHTHLAKGKNIEGKTVWLPVPSWSVNYDVKFSTKWSVGLQTDLTMEAFIVEDDDGEDLERDQPIAIVPVAIFKPGQYFGFIAGVGVELEKEENLGLIRLGIEYGVELTDEWEAGISAVWDNKWGHYNSWAIEFSFSKIFRKRS